MEKVKQTSFKKTLGQVPGSVVYIGKKEASDPQHIEVFNYNKIFFEELELKVIDEAYPSTDSKTMIYIL